ncbi:nitrite reductase small subunit NirD [Microbacterium abyssi]|uniref:nitrite reductase small subunit NirD n=1 Tax=Microbacterium abyssi TaxID=2782166 RepID=UPI001889AC75|nr:nitrite reductase small subunit NirD [Microbacterium sp. A18JL241]
MSVVAADTTAVRVCRIDDLEVERGRAALVGSEQVAVFLLCDGSIQAVSNLDPFSGANVISRGIVGTRGESPTVASPMHKQVFDLRTGECLESQGRPEAHLPVWRVIVSGEDVHLLPPSAAPARHPTLED